MPDISLSEAIREAYASAPGRVIYHTIEIRHASLTHPIRLVLGNDNIEARLEAGAPANPGEIVTFIRYYFRFTKPEVSPEGVPTLEIEIENIDRMITAALIEVSKSQTPTKATYREFLDTGLTVGPENDPPTHMDISSATASPLSVVAVAGFPNLMNRKFPSQEYDAEVWPGLVVA